MSTGAKRVMADQENKQAEVVSPGWVSNEAFLAGYGLAQAVPLTHCPMPLQVRGVLPLQSLLFGMQAPPHMPMLQTLGHTMPLLIQRPVVSQSCG